ncbi:MAG TPA: hypothetical protein DEO65_04490 [Bacillus bacterium]|nr:hypothetical protein [Bacillus sp. (in: firmicutes)]
MAYFNVRFKLINGEEKLYVQYKAKDYGHVANEVMNSNDGWFGVYGDLTNLSNVLTCSIIEVDEDGYEIASK